MKGPCEHCGNPDKSRWPSDCLYKGTYPSRRAFVRSTFDPPCSLDAYDEGRAELRRSNRKLATTGVALVALILGLIWWFA